MPSLPRHRQRGGFDSRHEYRAVSTSEAETRAEGRREGAPAALVTLLAFVALAGVSLARAHDLLGLPWWVWLVVACPALLLTLDLALTHRGSGIVRSREEALALLGFLVLGNIATLAILVVRLVTENTSDLTGGELLLTAFAIWSTDVLVFGLAFWELDAGGPVARMQAAGRSPTDFQFPQDSNGDRPSGEWRPQVWDYLYVSLTNAIAFSPTDTMPLSLRAKSVMALESVTSAVIVILVTARAVNVLGS